MHTIRSIVETQRVNNRSVIVDSPTVRTNHVMKGRSYNKISRGNAACYHRSAIVESPTVRTKNVTFHRVAKTTECNLRVGLMYVAFAAWR